MTTFKTTVKYVPTIGTLDLDSGIAQHVGGPKHDRLIDEVNAVLGPMDEERLVVYYATRNYEDAGRVLGVSQELLQAWYRRLSQRANRCPRGKCCQATRRS